jgi:hypothetical protein
MSTYDLIAQSKKSFAIKTILTILLQSAQKSVVSPLGSYH